MRAHLGVPALRRAARRCADKAPPLPPQVIVTDSAGIRETSCPIEAEGVARAREAAAAADILVLVEDGGAAAGGGGSGPQSLEQALAEYGLGVAPGGRPPLLLRLLNKADLLPAQRGGDGGQQGGGGAAAGGAPLRVSCATGQGLDAFLAALQGAVGRVVGGGAGTADAAATALLTRARQRHHLAECVAALQRYEAAPHELELAAEELRAAARALGAVTGALDTEAMLDSLFSQFCIGK